MGTNEIETRWRWSPDWLITLLVGGAAFALYALTLAPTVLAGDGGEFQFVPYLLGVAHPTGYPLYCLLGWAWTHLLPVGDVAYRMNLFSAFWAALAVGLLYPTARSLLRQAIPALSPAVQRLLAALAATTFAVTPTFWSQAIMAEVYSLHLFFVVALLYLLLTWSQRIASASPSHAGGIEGGRFLLFTAGCFGLSLAHHRTTLLLAPAILAYLGLARPPVLGNWRRMGRRVGIAALFLLLPLVLYFYIPLRAPHTPYLHLPLTESRALVLYDSTLSGFVDFILGGPFGGSLDFSVDWGARLAMAWSLLRDEVGWIGVALALLGAARLACTRRWALLALTGLTYVVMVAFNLVYTIGDIFVLFIPPYLVVVLWLVVGVGTLAQVGQQLANRGKAVTLLVTLPFFALPLGMMLTHYADMDRSQRTSARTRWEAILAEPLPRGAVLVSNDRNNIMPMWYFQYVDGKRADLLGLFPLITPEYPTLGHILDLALGTGRPVYLIKEMPGVEVKVRVQPEGRLWRVLGPAVEGEPAYPSNARLADAATLVGYDCSPPSPHLGETLRVSLYWEALRPLEAEYHTFVHLLDAAGQKLTQSDRQPGGVYYPTQFWRPGERLRDDHLLTVPADAQVGVYQLLAGMYTLADDGALERLGEPVVVGQVEIKP